MIRIVMKLSRTPWSVSSVESRAISLVRVDVIWSRRVVAIIVVASNTSHGIALRETPPIPTKSYSDIFERSWMRWTRSPPNPYRSRNQRSACARRTRGYRIGVLDSERIPVLAVANPAFNLVVQEASTWHCLCWRCKRGNERIYRCTT